MANFTNKARFVLKEPSSQAPTTIYLICRGCTPRLKYSAGIQISPTHWDASTERPTVETKGFDRNLKRQLSEITLHLNRMSECIDGINSRILTERITPTPELFKSTLDEQFRSKAAKPEIKKLDFFEWAEEFISKVESGEITIARSGKKYSESAPKNYRKIVNHLTEFQKATGFKVTFDSIDLHFYQKFINYLNRQSKATNTIGDLIKNVKVLMRQAMKQGMHTNTAFQDQDFIKPTEEVENIYLTEAEVNTIYALDLSGRPGLDRVRDVFIIGCGTGLRFSDLHQIQRENISSDGNFITIRTQKTNKPVYIPLNPKVKSILEKYDGTIPRVLTNQRMNDHLKDIAKLAKLDESVSLTMTRGGKRIIKTLKKWQLVTTHTARRSFATNAYLAGIPSIDIMRLTGHKTETSFMKYIKVSNEELAIRMATHEFFKGSALKIAN
ncbi:site-specific integrase [Arundinibacter roseus]|uniref:Integrase n=1 Tax=Arundinibacter roseus TaxID=2070510 RepID=A0A4R4KFG2_9BACT|nr:site-specific integrase [Arundinibacter roseus]TDB65269.1 integrase [Arundinibacter roseus]